MTQTHTLQRGLAGALVIVAGMMGMLVGPASAADGLTPAEITVSADEVANSTIVSKTAQLPVQGSAGDTITLVKNGEPSAFSFDSVSVDNSDVDATIQNEEVVLELQNSVDSTVSVTLDLQLGEYLTGDTVTYQDFPIVEDTSTDSSLVYLTVEVGQIVDFGVSPLEASPSGEYNGKPVYTLPLSDGAELRIHDPVDEYGNSVGNSATPNFYMGDIRMEAVNANFASSAEYPAWYSDTRFTIANGELLEPELGFFNMTLSVHDAEQSFYIRFYPGDVGINASVEDTAFLSNESTALSVDLGADTVAAWVDLSLTDNSSAGEYAVSGDSPEFEFVSTAGSHNISTIGGYINDIESGVWNLTIGNATAGTYSLTVDVMPSVDDPATRDTVTFRVHGPVANATGACNRSFVGMAHDPDPLGVTIDRLTDTAGQTITSADVHIDAITVANRSIHRVDASASALPLTLNVDPTALNESGVGPGPAPVAATLSWTDNGTTHTETVTLDRVDLVHEVATPTPTTADWVPVTAPMPYDRIVYEGARTDATGAPLEAHWSAEAGYVPFNATAHRRQPLASGWYVAGASRIGYVYATDGVAERTRMLDPGWHLLGPPLDLTDRVEHSLDSVLPGTAADRRAHYAGLPVNAPENIDIGPYDTYWVHLNATAEQPLPGAGYDPATRGDRP